MTLVVVALGGNALLRRGDPWTAASQQRAAASAAQGLAPLAADRRLVVTHGNGPQIGLLALQEDALAVRPRATLDVLGAETQGMIGYLLEQELDNVLRTVPVATLLTRVVVDADDPAFASPTKPIGPTYSEPDATALAQERGWAMAADEDGFRRVVASPQPRRILPMAGIRLLVERDVVTICAGGGGIPVVEEADGRHRGVEAVIDKDLASALLAVDLDADTLLLLTDVQAVWDRWGTPQARPIRRASPAALRRLGFASGSMGPKVEAVCRFVEATRRPAAIGSLGQAAAVLQSRAGTAVVPADDELLELGPAA